jgi:hypothetical protein
MPSKCKCFSENCVIHDLCGCGKIKKRVSKCCRNCFAPKHTCIGCGKSRPKTSAKHCRDCYYQMRSSNTLKDCRPISSLIYVNCKSANRNKYNSIRAHARRVVSALRMRKICSCCSFDQGIQVCHITPIKDFEV